jgi:hypothetical protein
MKFQDIVLSELGRKYYTLANKVLRGSEADRKLDIFLTPADATLPEGEHDVVKYTRYWGTQTES